MALTMPLPGTQRVLFRDESGGVAPALWRVAAMEGVEGAVELSREEERVLPEAGRETRLPGFAAEETCAFLAAPGASLLKAAQAPVAGKKRPRANRPLRAKRRPRRKKRPRAKNRPGASRPRRARSAASVRKAPREREKPRLSARAQAIALQTGLNPPRRSRSLQEIIDDRWRRSRIDPARPSRARRGHGHAGGKPGGARRGSVARRLAHRGDAPETGRGGRRAGRPLRRDPEGQRPPRRGGARPPP